MESPLQITFANMDAAPAVEDRARELFGRLERLHSGIISCRVAISAPNHRHRKGRLYHVSIDLQIPGHTIAVHRDPPEHQAHQDVLVALRDAFDAAARQVQGAASRARGEVKVHQPGPH